MDKATTTKAISWVGARLREPSTYVGLAVTLVALHVGNVDTWVAAIKSIGIGLGGVIAIVMPEA